MGEFATITVAEKGSRTTRTGKTVFWVKDVTGAEFAAWDASMVSDLNPGDTVSVEFEVSTNTTADGRSFTNRTIRNIGSPIQRSTSFEAPASANGNRVVVTDKDTMICRQTAGKCVADLFNGREWTLDEILWWLDFFTTYFTTGVPIEKKAESGPPEFDDDIPFD